jgi:hypothetical protein
MSTSIRLVEMILRGKKDQFNTVIKEYLNDRASVMMEQIYLEQSKNILKLIEPIQEQLKEIVPEPVTISVFVAESSYQLRDGGIGVLTETQQDSVGKLYKSLNTDNRQRLVKLLSESQESFNRILNLAKIESTKNGNK